MRWSNYICAQKNNNQQLLSDEGSLLNIVSYDRLFKRRGQKCFSAPQQRHLRPNLGTPNTGFNRGSPPTFIPQLRGMNPGLNPVFGVLRYGPRDLHKDRLAHLPHGDFCVRAKLAFKPYGDWGLMQKGQLALLQHGDSMETSAKGPIRPPAAWNILKSD
jgi:hypothetical protein